MPVDEQKPDHADADHVCALCNEDGDFDDYLRSVAVKVTEHGFTVIGVIGEGDQPGWTYTIGLEQSRSHPELLIAGLDHQVAYGVLCILAERVLTGDRLEAGTPLTGCLAGGYELVPLDIMDVKDGDWFNIAHHYYEDEEFSAFQVVWPDLDNNYPWEPDYEQGYHQCLIGEPP